MAAICAAALVPQLAYAGACSTLESGGIPATQDFSAILDKARSVNVTKDEFETTEAYKARLANVGKQAFGDTEELVFAWKIPPELITYNADNQNIFIPPYHYRSCPGVWPPRSAVFTVGKVNRLLGNNSVACLAQTVSKHAEPSYTGTNAMGAQIQIDVTREQRQGVFLGMHDGSYDAVHGYNASMMVIPTTMSAIVLPPDGARSLKENGAFVIVARPRAPLYFESRGESTPTFDKPQKTQWENQMLVADVLCTAVIDTKANQVRKLHWDKPKGVR
ncbi:MULTISPECIES: hypothetical protein [unclassified Caulobacter]|jgi:hypothetical protein|uniref:hypothetical protein n=1 Tax=unclassified Caulobacter TaxID=2648921 RepID=UPI0006F43034|nr:MULTISPECIES: hypothetical protein [unclassified Caulobacter]KQV55705.1 hypothetical protein ASC62_17375 [Caulobacter sp. Root342]KQV71123.1 hypothetical protein ASC70_05880 [Caulobacter sp. Root343]